MTIPRDAQAAPTFCFSSKSRKTPRLPSGVKLTLYTWVGVSEVRTIDLLGVVVDVYREPDAGAR